MITVFNGRDHGLTIILHPPYLDGIALLIRIKQRIGCLQTWCYRIADASQIHHTSSSHLTIKRNMSMSNNDQICLAACQPSLQLVITVRGLDARSVISAWRSMDTEHAGPIW